MKINFEPLKNWFGFTRRERRSSFLLLLIIIFIIAVRYTVPVSNIEIEDITGELLIESSTLIYEAEEYIPERKLFSFDPNLSSYDTLLLLGLTEREARTLISYRNKGGQFRKAGDLNRIYGIDESKAAKLIPYVVVTPVREKTVPADSILQSRYRIEINSCDSASLVRLPGIGPVLSVRIIKYRNLLGGFANIEQIKEVYGLPEETYELIKSSLFVDTLTIKKININAADYKELVRLPYFERYEVSSILKYRQINGTIKNINELTDNELISIEKANKVKPYLLF
jgi:competence protein ComEA